MVDGARQVATRSVLFTDVVGSTEMRIRLGEDAADDVRRAHDKMLTEAVEAQGGNVVKGTGDGIHAAPTVQSGTSCSLIAPAPGTC